MLVRRFRDHDAAQTTVQLPEGTNKARLLNRLLAVWLQQRTYIVSRLTRPFQYGVSRDTAYLPLLLLSEKADDPSGTVDALLQEVKAPMERTEFKLPPVEQWISGMSVSTCAHTSIDADTV